MSMFLITIVVAAVAVPALFVLGAVLMTRGATPTERPAILLAFGWAFGAVLRARGGRREAPEAQKVLAADASLTLADDSHVLGFLEPAQVVDTDKRLPSSSDTTTDRQDLPTGPEGEGPSYSDGSL